MCYCGKHSSDLLCDYWNSPVGIKETKIMLKFTNKIEAIKALRELPTLIVESAKVQESLNGSGTVIISGASAIRPGIGLKEAKDFVEAVMEFGSNYHKKICLSCNKEIKEVAPAYCPFCGRFSPFGC